MRLVYLDDSAGESDLQIIGATIMPEGGFLSIEKYLSGLIDKYVPIEFRGAFEFHASAIYNSKPPFDALSRDQAIGILAECANMLHHVGMPIIYGAVDCRKLRGGIYATAQPTDIAFRACVQGLAKWFTENVSDQLGIFICDEPSNPKIIQDLLKAFRAYRRPLKSEEHVRGLLEYVHDDMYFGDSAYSVGIQMTDICSYIILRHLQGKQDTEFLYEQIEPHIFYGVIEPDGAPHGSGASGNAFR